MMKTSYKIFFLLVVSIIWIFIGCATTKVKIPSYIGRWDYELETPQGNQKGWLILNQVEKELTGSINSDMGSTDLRDLKVEENVLNANFYAFDMDMDITGEFVDEVFNGKIIVQGYELPFTAYKAKQ